jgi:hypothetical protein
MLPLQRITPLFLLVLFGWMALSTSSRVGVTFDETAHLTAGYSYWTTGEYRLQPENGNLPQRWAALPMLVTKPNAPAWAGKAWTSADVWWFGREIFFHAHNDVQALLLKGRGMILMFGIALVTVVYWWSRALFGATGGLLSLGFAVFCPHLLAHSALITSDIAVTLGFMLALATWWRLCHRITLGRVIAAGFAMGFLALAKFSAALFAPIALLILIVRCLRPTPLRWQFGRHRGRLVGTRCFLAILGSGIAAAALSIGLIWAAFGFRYSASLDPDQSFSRPWSVVMLEQPREVTSNPDGVASPATEQFHAGPVQKFVGWARNHELLPEAYLYGLAFTDYHSRGRSAYFGGEYRMTGWWEFFPVAFMLKTTLPALLLFVLTFIVCARSKLALRTRWIYRLTPLLIFVGVYWLFAITSHLNIGHRHLLPIYPALYVMVGMIGNHTPRNRSRFWMISACCLLAWHALESWRVRPHYLTYFNAIVGGPSEGHRYYVDSTLDWGQGLPDLQVWLQANRQDKPVFLSYFGSDDPQRFDIKATRIGDMYFNYSPRILLPTLTAGIYCISATMLHRVYTQVTGPWSAVYETAYQKLAGEIEQQTISPKTLPQHLEMFEQLRFGRLCHFLKYRQPDALVGNTIFVFRLSEEEIDIALNASWDSTREFQP